MLDRPELRKCPANYVPLTPVSFLARAASFFGDRLAIVHGDRRVTYRAFYARARQLAHALTKAGIKRGDTVAIMAPNVPAMLEAHYAVPMIGAVLNPINVRLDAAAIAFCLEHGEAKLLLADREFHGVVAPVLDKLGAKRPIVIDIADTETVDAPAFGGIEYERFIAAGDPHFSYCGPEDEWDSICLLYTSGTTGNPKGAVYSHRGAHLGALANAMTFKLDHESRYLWTLPMFHCSGWTFTWAVTAAGGTHVCLRRVEPKRIFDLIAEHRVTHMCGAPIVLNMLVHAPASDKRALPTRPKVATGGAAPPAIVIERMEAMGFEVLHLYGTTESYGPSTYCAHMSAWDTGDTTLRYALMARQGVSNPLIEDMVVANADTLAPMPRDGAAIGEIMMRGNTIMKGYLKNEARHDGRVCRRLLSFRRSRGLAWRRLHRRQGPLEGHHHLGRREHLVPGGGGSPLSPPGGHGGRRRRKTRRKMGRDALRLRYAEARRAANHGQRYHRLLPGQHGALQGAKDHRVRTSAEDLDRQDPEVRPARAGETDRHAIALTSRLRL